MAVCKVTYDLDEGSPTYPNVFRDSPRLADKLKTLKDALVEIERLTQEPVVGEALLESLTDCLHGTCDLAAMFFKYIGDDFVSSAHFDEEHDYGYQFATFNHVPEVE